ncbi:LexA family transcriptional regulator [Alloalcanivorax sp. C16-1]|uniref:LexA family transcriptional regulator n=1 Tax=Alloalcanivorax sp. C16-1 TaxID=3390051 RepID=UPI003970D94F
MSVQTNLSFLMARAHMNPHSLAKETGVKQPTIFRILEGESLTPRDKTLRPLADFFGVSVQDLRYADLPASAQGDRYPGPANAPMVLREHDSSHGYDAGAQQNVEPARAPKNRRTAPVISWVQAGDWAEAADPYPPGDGEGFEEVPDTAGPNVFWLRVVGDSMTAPTGMSIPEGHLILVDPDQQAENGSLVVAKLTETDEVTFKKLVIDAGQKYLKPLNPAYETIKINGNCRMVGVVREAKVKFL